MGERKVIQKYYPPDFDPAKLPRAKGSKNNQWVVRTMAPFSMRCVSCGNYIYHGTKFNARMENANEDYLGIRIKRFYVKCTRCSREITFKTDPRTSDYVIEEGAVRNFDGKKIGMKMMEEFKAKREAEEQGNAMKVLENRTLDNKMELDILDALDEIRSLNAKTSKLDPEEVLHRIQEERKRKEAEAAGEVVDDEEQKALDALTEYPFASSFLSFTRRKPFRKMVKDAVKRLDDDEKEGGLGSDDEADLIDPFHPDLFRPFVKKEGEKDDDGFAIPKPIKVRKTNKKDQSGIISVGVGSDKQIRLKFKPRYRDDAVLKKERVDEPELHTPQSDQSKSKTHDEMKVEPMPQGEDEVVVENSGFSLVNY